MGTSIVQNTYYLLSIITFVWMLRRYKNSSFLLFLLLVFYEGTLTYWIPGLSAQIMRIIYVLWATYLLVSTNAWNVLKGKMLYLLWTFIAFSVYFILVSIIQNGDGIFLTFSQYSKYYVPFAAIMVFGYYHYRNPAYIIFFNKFFGEIILIQIITAVIKYTLFGFHEWEGMVGTFGYISGGGTGTSFPLVALAWVLVNSNMELKGAKSWMFILGLMLIGIATGKRAVIILFPAFFLLFASYVAKHKYKKGVIATIALVPLLFYFGLRLTPSLNPENKVWGSYDPEYALNYAEDYSMGKEDKAGDRGKGNGRVGAASLIFENIMNVDNYTSKTWFGYGLDRIYVYKTGTYNDENYNYGINHRGSMTGYVMMFLSIGLIGLLLFIVYYWFYFIPVKYWRLRLTLFGMVMFDFIFYNTEIIRTPCLAILLVFVMYYSQIQYTQSGKFVGQKHKYFQ